MLARRRGGDAEEFCAGRPLGHGAGWQGRRDLRVLQFSVRVHTAGSRRGVGATGTRPKAFSLLMASEAKAIWNVAETRFHSAPARPFGQAAAQFSTRLLSGLSSENVGTS